MTKEEIFLKAIAKAEENGWHQDGFFEDNAKVFNFIEWVEDGWPILFYDHDFAAAFWGDLTVCGDCGAEHSKTTGIHADRYGFYCKSCGTDNERGDPAWEYHLPKMVLSLNPLLYMEDHWPKEV